MHSERDPERVTARSVREFVDLRHARVLDIGCGDGHLMWGYADTAQHVVGIDPNTRFLAAARRDCPPALRKRVTFAQARAEALPFPPDTFGTAIMAWSL